MSGDARIVRALVCLALLAIVTACGGGADASNSSATPPFIEAGDFDEISDRGTLRVLVPRTDRADFLPRSGDAMAEERDLIEEFARQNNLEPFWVSVDSRSDLILTRSAGQPRSACRWPGGSTWRWGCLT